MVYRHESRKIKRLEMIQFILFVVGTLPFVLAMILALITSLAHATEADYRDMLCVGMEQEVRLPNGTRADCLTDTHAIEVEFSEKWAEGLGQALSYAASTGKQPAIFLICRQEQDKCLAHALRLEEAIAYWQLPVTVWKK